MENWSREETEFANILHAMKMADFNLFKKNYRFAYHNYETQTGWKIHQINENYLRESERAEQLLNEFYENIFPVFKPNYSLEQRINLGNQFIESIAGNAIEHFGPTDMFYRINDANSIYFGNLYNDLFEFIEILYFSLILFIHFLKEKQTSRKTTLKLKDNHAVKVLFTDILFNQNVTSVTEDELYSAIDTAVKKLKSMNANLKKKQTKIQTLIENTAKVVDDIKKQRIREVQNKKNLVNLSTNVLRNRELGHHPGKHGLKKVYQRTKPKMPEYTFSHISPPKTGRKRSRSRSRSPQENQTQRANSGRSVRPRQ